MPVFLMHGTDDSLCFSDGSEWVRDHAGTPLEFTKLRMFKVRLSVYVHVCPLLVCVLMLYEHWIVHFRELDMRSFMRRKLPKWALSTIQGALLRPL